jgi:hypothetical protein
LLIDKEVALESMHKQAVEIISLLGKRKAKLKLYLNVSILFRKVGIALGYIQLQETSESFA